MRVGIFPWMKLPSQRRVYAEHIWVLFLSRELCQGIVTPVQLILRINVVRFFSVCQIFMLGMLSSRFAFADLKASRRDLTEKTSENPSRTLILRQNGVKPHDVFTLEKEEIL